MARPRASLQQSQTARPDRDQGGWVVTEDGHLARRGRDQSAMKMRHERVLMENLRLSKARGGIKKQNTCSKLCTGSIEDDLSLLAMLEEGSGKLSDPKYFDLLLLVDEWRRNRCAARPRLCMAGMQACMRAQGKGSGASLRR